jgi:hypothetical protein
MDETHAMQTVAATRQVGKRHAIFCALLALGGFAHAEQEMAGIRFTGSGFLTLAAGKVFGGDPAQDFNGYKAPLYVSDFAQAGIYESGRVSMRPDSRLGLQGAAYFSPDSSLTGQVVARGAQGGKVNLEWLYASHNLNDKLTVQVGRKRLPLFYYSETQDVGFTYPWVHLPPQPYGWDIVNYNGANLLYRDQWGNWASSMNFFAGNETRKDNPYWKIYNGRHTRTDSKWSRIVGADLSLNRDWLEVRGAYIQSKFQDRFEDPSLPPTYSYSLSAGQKIYTLSFAIDYQNWLLRNEYMVMDRISVGEKDYAQLLGVGYRIGKFLPMLTWANYKLKYFPGKADPSLLIDPASIDPTTEEAHSTLALTLRYNLTATSAVKLQLERWQDRGGANFNAGIPYGNPKLLSVSYDLVF